MGRGCSEKPARADGNAVDLHGNTNALITWRLGMYDARRCIGATRRTIGLRYSRCPGVLHEVMRVVSSPKQSQLREEDCVLPPLRVRVRVAHAAGRERVLEEVVVGNRTLLVVLQKHRKDEKVGEGGGIYRRRWHRQPWDKRQTAITWPESTASRKSMDMDRDYNQTRNRYMYAGLIG